MKKKVTLIILALGFAMLFAALAPALACPPKCFSFTAGSVAVSNPSVPGKIIPTNNGVIGVGTGIIDYGYSSILGYGVANEKDWYYYNTDPSSPAFLTGPGVSTSISSIDKEQNIYTFNGLGLWTYTGPTFTYNGPTCDAAVHGAVITTGEAFFSVLVTGTGTIQYTSGPWASETAVDTWAGVSFIDGSGIYSATAYVH
ncbi:MAG TPA: hypothetical protein VLU95_01070 [Candidatus Acidoferrum sp.]|nr:hypothetical protein [Candidatus Acidoferrum sp.]